MNGSLKTKTSNGAVSYKSMLTRNTKNSRTSKVSGVSHATSRRDQLDTEQLEGVQEEGMEEVREEELQDLANMTEDDFLACILCRKDLTEEEQLINAGLLKDALEKG